MKHDLHKHQRLAVEVIRQTLEPKGFSISTRFGGRHLHVVAATATGSARFTVHHGTSQDDRLVLNWARQWARRIAAGRPS